MKSKIFWYCCFCPVYTNQQDNHCLLCRPIFRAAMLEKRCNILIRVLRFDDSLTHLVREKEDPAAAISGVFNRFIKNCQEIYEIGAFACVDETLIPFRGGCKFRVFMPNKPAKYGIKLMCLTDARNFFFPTLIFMLEKIVME